MEYPGALKTTKQKKIKEYENQINNFKGTPLKIKPCPTN